MKIELNILKIWKFSNSNFDNFEIWKLIKIHNFLEQSRSTFINLVFPPLILE